MYLKKMLLAGAMSLVATAAWAECKNDVEVKSLTNAFPAYEAMTAVMEKCGNFTAELDKDHRLKLEDALSANPALYQIISTTNSTSVGLLDKDLLRPLDDLVAKYGQNLNENQFIRVDGKIMAIAAFVNTQHLMYRDDIFMELEIEVPKTWDEVLAAAEKIKGSGKVDYPFGGYYKAGWNLGFVFMNHYLGNGGQLVDENNMPTINNEIGIETLENMKKLTAYMDPEYLVSDTTFVTKQLQQGKIAMANLWASRAAAVNDENESSFSGKIIMAAAPQGKAMPAATLWWDGWAIPKNISDEQAEAAFKLAVEAMGEATIKEHNDKAIWLAKGYEPGALAAGAAMTAENGAPNYPSNKAATAIHAALGDGIADFLTGKKDAASTLADVEADYTSKAKETGVIQ